MADGFRVLLSGVGGQGLVLVSRVLGNACALAGVRAVTGEQHGLSQRSGSISIHFSMGDAVRSPLIPAGTADAIMGLEALEALRYIEYLRAGGVALTSTLVVHPVTETRDVAGKKAGGYWTHERVADLLGQVAGRVVALDARGFASAAGSPLAENMVMLGALSRVPGFPLDAAVLGEAVGAAVPSASDVNLKAFESGRQAVP
jgi:indolepyruvate ferredoxin oxidoreductase, beta subunit